MKNCNKNQRRNSSSTFTQQSIHRTDERVQILCVAINKELVSNWRFLPVKASPSTFTKSQDSNQVPYSGSMNRLAIELNNHAVSELQNGSLYNAIESISLACSMMSLQGHVHSTTIDPTRYRFHWSECSPEALKTHSDQADCTNEKCLYLGFLLISPPEGSNDSENSERFCPCAFAWAILYK